MKSNSKSGLGNQGGGPQKGASLGQVSKATSDGASTPGTNMAGDSGGGGGSINSVKQERPRESGLGN